MKTTKTFNACGPHLSAPICLALLLGCGSSSGSGPGTTTAAFGGATSGGGSGGNAGTSKGGKTSQTGGGAGEQAGGGGGSSGSGGVTMGGGVSNAGSAGSGPTNGGGPPVVVTNCDNLPEVDKWELITPPAFQTPPNMEVLAIVVTPHDQAVYAAAGNATNGGSEGTGVYKSTDCGATWKLVSTGKNSNKLLTGDPWAMLGDPVTPEVLYINNGYGEDPTLYKSINQGGDFEQLATHPVWGVASFVQAIAMDPTNHLHLAVTFHRTCDAPYSPLCIGVSTNGGDKWEIMSGPPEVTGWAEAASLSIFGPDNYLFTAGDAWHTSNSGQSWKKVSTQGLFGSYQGSTVIGPKGEIYLGANGAVLVSTDEGESFSPIMGSPNSSVLIHDGERLFISHPYGGETPVWYARFDDITNWKQMPDKMGRGANALAYDPEHGLIYAANWVHGLWRMRSQVK
jgi:hypothetical protein